MSEFQEAIERDMARINAAFKPVADELRAAVPVAIAEWARAWSALLNPPAGGPDEQKESK